MLSDLSGLFASSCRSAASADLKELQESSKIASIRELQVYAQKAARSVKLGVETERAGFSHLLDAQDLFPYAESVLTEVPIQTEEAAFALMEKFQAIRSISLKSAQSARDLESLLNGTGGHLAVSAAADHTRNTVQLEKKSISEIAVFNKENEKGLQSISQEINSGLDLLHGIDEITERSRLIAFNLAVEASHFGAQGGGFKIIAKELRNLNEQSAEFSHKVSTMLHRFREHNENLVHNMSERSHKMILDVENGMTAAEEAIESLITASTATVNFAYEMSQTSKEIDRDLDKVLESLQFQDITRQMVEGVVGMIKSAKNHLHELADLVGAEQIMDKQKRKENSETLRQQLLSLSKTNGEKKAIMEVKL
jgi:methyl-accepting chemotaxis protein